MKKTTKKTKTKAKPKVKSKLKNKKVTKTTSKVEKLVSGKPCVSCKEDIHPKRLEILPFTEKCTKCSDTGRKGGITVTKGEGDHTYNEVIIMEPEQLKRLEEFERKSGNIIDDPLNFENPEFEEEPTSNEDDIIESED